MENKNYLFFIYIFHMILYKSKSLLEEQENLERENTIYINAKINEI